MSTEQHARAAFEAQPLADIIRNLTDPFAALPSFADNFFNVVGRSVLMWGQLETSLDNLLVIARDVAIRDGKTFEMKTSLSRKLITLRQVYDQSPSLAHLKSDAHYVARRIGNLGEDRHLVMHSTFLRFKDDPPRIVLRSAKHNRGQVRIRELEPQLAHLAQIAGAFHATRSQVLALIVTTRSVVDPGLSQRALELAQAGDVSFLPSGI